MDYNAVLDCIEQCRECGDFCQDILANVCLEKGGAHVKEKHVKLMLDCIQICKTAADYMVRQSEMQAPVCRACAEVCEACAVSCEEIGGEDMNDCAEMCRASAECCRELAENSA